MTVTNNEVSLMRSDDKESMDVVPEPMFYSTKESDYVQKNYDLLNELESLKSQLRIARNSSLESKIVVEKTQSELWEKNRLYESVKKELETVQSERMDLQMQLDVRQEI